MSDLVYVHKYKELIKKIDKLQIVHKENIKVVVVSKNQEYGKIVTLNKLGHIDFGENYVDEAYKKINEIGDSSIIWHFIGRVQSNKIKKICDLFSWIHTISSMKHIEKIDQTCEQLEKVMNICIQINIDNEDSKGGITIDDYGVFSANIHKLKNVKLRGIMAIPQANKPCDDSFAKMSNLYNKYDYLDTLSMGMSKDFVTAIENGANMLRIGQEIFGKRT